MNEQGASNINLKGFLVSYGEGGGERLLGELWRGMRGRGFLVSYGGEGHLGELWRGRRGRGFLVRLHV